MFYETPRSEITQQVVELWGDNSIDMLANSILFKRVWMGTENQLGGIVVCEERGHLIRNIWLISRASASMYSLAAERLRPRPWLRPGGGGDHQLLTPFYFFPCNAHRVSAKNSHSRGAWYRPFHFHGFAANDYITSWSYSLLLPRFSAWNQRKYISDLRGRAGRRCPKPIA